MTSAIVFVTSKEVFLEEEEEKHKFLHHVLGRLLILFLSFPLLCWYFEFFPLIDEDFEPNEAPAAAAGKWDGEDEDDVLDSWDADPAEKKKAAPAPKPKAAEKKKAEPEWNDETLSDPEAEKERQKRKQLESDLQHATDLFGVTDVDLKEIAAESLNREKLGKYESTCPTDNNDFVRFDFCPILFPSKERRLIVISFF